MDSSKLNTQELKPDEPVSLHSPQSPIPSENMLTTLKGNKDSGVKKIVDEVKAKFAPHNANPGPVMPEQFNIKEEGTKEERRAKAEELNK